LCSHGNLYDSPSLKKIIGVVAVLARVQPHQNQFPATLWRGQPQNSLNDQQSITHTTNRQECDVATF
ncbi:hypothetical protein M9Y22_23515, partial [Escherichia coli]|nr:hypothetical protein [Escherichia coli]